MAVAQLWIVRRRMHISLIKNEKRLLAIVMAACCGLLTMNRVVSAQNWTLSGAPANPWTSIVSSADGSKLVVVSIDDGIFTSTNSGSTWLEVSNYSSGSDMWYPATRGIEWYSVASSADGVKLAAASFDGNGIYDSTNSGATWQFAGAPSFSWYGIASSADGTKLVAVAYYGWHIYATTNSGANWTPLTNFPSQHSANENLRAIASSADGSKLVAASALYNGQGQICISTNAGQTWMQVTNVSGNWDSVASSADGRILAAAPQNDSIYVSTNSGTTWSATLTPSEVWVSVASSADGTKLIAGSLDVLYTSDDSGITWTSNSVPSGYWNSVASSADGNERVAVDDSGSGSGLWSSQTTPAPCLNITPTSDNLTLSWIIPSINFVLQQNLDLTTTNWTDVTNPPALKLTNLQYEVTLPLANNSGFYRLAAP